MSVCIWICVEEIGRGLGAEVVYKKKMCNSEGELVY